MADYKVKMNSYNVRLNSNQTHSAESSADQNEDNNEVEYKSKMNSYNVKMNSSAPHKASQQVNSHSLLSNLSDVEAPDLGSLDPNEENVLAYDPETNRYKVIPIDNIIAESIEGEVIEIVQNNLNIDIIDAGEF